VALTPPRTRQSAGRLGTLAGYKKWVEHLKNTQKRAFWGVFADLL
jgi:hypothetical protein